MNTDLIPTMQTTGVAQDLFDHFGLPTVAGINVSQLPVIAFNFIWNEFYRDQDLQAKRVDLDTTVPHCAWEKDYFSTARPWAQKGPQVSIPIGDSADVHVNAGATQAVGAYSDVDAQISGFNSSGANLLLDAAAIGADNQLYADLTGAAGADPLDVRRAWGLQRFMENAARFGSRYPEKMRSLGSTYSGLMDRPEFLGGGSQAISFSEVLQSTPDFVSDPGHDFGVGDMYGHGIAAMRSNQYGRKIQEHGLVISVMSVRPKTIYQDGIHREWLKTDREDFHDPYLEFIGQQEVWLDELYAQPAQKDVVFGFSDKYQEYRGAPSCVSGLFRNTLDFWHLARKFTEVPTLNDDFVKCVPSKRIFNEQTQDALWCMLHHKIACHRNIAKTATPRLI